MAGERLTRDDWVRAGLKALAREGAAVLKADRLSRELGVSRGSFYWHFEDVEAFCAAVLEGWQSVAYERIVSDLERLDGGRLGVLITGALKSDGALERAVRAWATHDARARAMVEAVDERRIGYLAAEIMRAGHPKRVAAARAHLIYWAYLGRFFAVQQPRPAMLGDISQELVQLAEGRKRPAGRAK
jgi:AcrR family transcriptional regulator